jgi:hypothetical protein
LVSAPTLPSPDKQKSLAFGRRALPRWP